MISALVRVPSCFASAPSSDVCMEFPPDGIQDPSPCLVNFPLAQGAVIPPQQKGESEALFPQWNLTPLIRVKQLHLPDQLRIELGQEMPDPSRLNRLLDDQGQIPLYLRMSWIGTKPSAGSDLPADRLPLNLPNKSRRFQAELFRRMGMNLPDPSHGIPLR